MRTLEEDQPGLCSRLLACFCSTSAYRAAQGWKRGRRQRRREKVHREDRAWQAEAGQVRRALPEVPHDLRPLSTFASPTAPGKKAFPLSTASTGSSGYDTAAQTTITDESREGRLPTGSRRKAFGPGAPRRAHPATRRHSTAHPTTTDSSSSDSGGSGPHYLAVREAARPPSEPEQREGPHFPLARAVQSHLAAQRDAGQPADQGAAAGPSAALKGVVF